jgi:PAT family beta-lactamase induction signal transducer AmpG
MLFLKQSMASKKPWSQTLKSLISWKVLVMAIFGFCSGFPFYIVKDVLKVWMTDAKVDLTTIGFFSAVSLPYTLKFLWSPLMDLIVPPLGRRRGWILITQILLAISIVALGQFDPNQSLKWIAITAIVVSFFGASQDIALDAFRREYLKDEELGLGTGIWMNTWRLGMYVAVGTAFLSADHNINYKYIHIILASLLLMGIFTVFFIKEPATEVKAPKSLKESVVGPFKEFFSRPGAWMILAFILLYKLGDNMASAMSIPFILSQGFSKTEYFVVVKGLGMIGLFGGALAGGALMLRLGISKALWIFGILQALSTYAFSLLISSDPTAQAWQSQRLYWLSGVVCFEFLAAGMGQAAYASYMATQTNKKFTATQYALLTSLMALPNSVAAAFSGWIADHLGWHMFYLSCSLAAIPGMLLLVKIAPWKKA